MRYIIDEIKDKAIPIAKEYGSKRMSLFGFCARGEAKNDSDIDLGLRDITNEGIVHNSWHEGG